MTDYSLFDRITAIRFEYEYETSNYRLLVYIRNILNTTDNLSYQTINTTLKAYFTRYPVIGITHNLINIVTANPHNHSSNIFYNYLDNIEVNLDNQHTDSDDEIMTDTDTEEDNNNNLNTSWVTDDLGNWNYVYQQPLYNSSISNASLSTDVLGNWSALIQPLSNSNLGQSIFNTLLGNTPNNQDIPIVITDNSYNQLQKTNYGNLGDNIKNNNKQCMISLDEFEDNDEIICLPCDHVFKTDEITEWLKNESYKCPICRMAAGESYAKLN